MLRSQVYENNDFSIRPLNRKTIVFVGESTRIFYRDRIAYKCDHGWERVTRIFVLALTSVFAEARRTEMSRGVEGRHGGRTRSLFAESENRMAIPRSCHSSTIRNVLVLLDAIGPRSSRPSFSGVLS